MPASCPICEQPIVSTAAHCSVCGFPTALAIEGLHAVEATPSGPAGPDGGTGPPTVPGVPTPGPRARIRPPPSPESELNGTISRDLRARMDLSHELGRGPDVTSELCQAALMEADGQVGEALTVLRSAQSRIEAETDQVVRQRLASLGARRDALRGADVRFAFGDELERIADALEGGRRPEAVGLLVEAERRLSQLESDWKGLQGLLGRIESLRNDAAELGLPLGEISGELEALRDRIRDAEITEEALDTFAQEAAQTLMLLHEAIPGSLEAELQRSGSVLDVLPEEHAVGASARRLHAEASRHLKKGRLSEAIQSVRELRRELEKLERLPPPPSSAPAPGSPTESDDAMLDRLLRKARSLAGRVRTLPPESETAHDAAVQIRQATDLLRARRLREADATLTQLMRVLAASGGS